ncbi:MAG: LysM peptidoglycan-binding domain-containing protein, partial [Roseobacter sp.]
MVIFFSRQRAFRATMTVSALAILSACSQGLDYDLRGIGGGLSTTDAAAQDTTAPPPTPDSRGIISYPTYQVAVAQNGDTINSVASRLGLDAPTLARFNGINENAPLRSGEIVALPTRVAEGSPQAGPVITGPIQSGGVDIGTLASGAIDRSGTTNTGGDVRVAALPPTQAAAQTGTE